MKQTDKDAVQSRQGSSAVRVSLCIILSLVEIYSIKKAVLSSASHIHHTIEWLDFLTSSEQSAVTSHQSPVSQIDQHWLIFPSTSTAFYDPLLLATLRNILHYDLVSWSKSCQPATCIACLLAVIATASCFTSVQKPRASDAKTPS